MNTVEIFAKRAEGKGGKVNEPASIADSFANIFEAGIVLPPFLSAHVTALFYFILFFCQAHFFMLRGLESIHRKATATAVVAAVHAPCVSFTRGCAPPVLFNRELCPIFSKRSERPHINTLPELLHIKQKLSL